MTKNLANLRKETDIQVQDPKRQEDKPKVGTPRHSMIKLSVQSQKHRLLKEARENDPSLKMELP
jgi:hypothetical protein